MSANNERILRVLEILKETDREHPMNTPTIVERLKKFNIESERKAVQRDIQDLNACGYEILRHENTRKGFYMDNRDFDDWELKILMDAAQNAKFLSESDSVKLAGKLCALASKDSQRTLRFMDVPADIHRGEPETKYWIDAIMRAMRSHKKVHFDYLWTGPDGTLQEKHVGGTKPVSPYTLIWRKDKYYLIGNYCEDVPLSYYRLDRIHNLEETDEPAVPLATFFHSDAEKELQAFVKKNVYNIRSSKGETVHLVLGLKVNGIDTVRDSFGKEAKISGIHDGKVTCSLTVSDSEGLYTWLMHHSRETYVIAPESVKKELMKRIQGMLADYE